MNMTPIMNRVRIEIFYEIPMNMILLGQILMKSNLSQLENSIFIEDDTPGKRTASLVSLSTKGLPHSPYDQTASGALGSPTSKLKSLRHRHLQRIHQRQQAKNENEQLNIHVPPIITMPPLIEFQRRLSHSSSMIEYDTSLVDTHFESTPPLRSLPRRETPILHPRMPIANDNSNLRRTLSQKLNNQPLSSFETVIRERSTRFTPENQNRSTAVQRVNQVVKKQIFLPFDKKS